MAAEESADESVEVSPPPLVVGVTGLDRGALTKTPAESLPIRIENRSTEDFTVKLSAYSLSRVAEQEVSLDSVRVAAGETASIDVRVADLRLPAQRLDHSASLRIMARPRHIERGDPEGSVAAQLFYHPDGTGFVFYDEATCEAEFDGGALTDLARDARDEAARMDVPEGRVVVFTGDWLVTPAVRADEAGGDR